MSHHAKTLGVNRIDLRRDLGTLAACAVQVERHVWRHLETKLVEEASSNPELELLVYVDFVSYDSAGFRLQMEMDVVESLGPAADPAALIGADALPPPVHDILMRDSSCGVKKVLQVDTAALLLVRFKGRLAGMCGNVRECAGLPHIDMTWHRLATNTGLDVPQNAKQKCVFFIMKIDMFDDRYTFPHEETVIDHHKC